MLEYDPPVLGRIHEGRFVLDLRTVDPGQDMILAADHVVDMGPGAGVHGGHVVAQGLPAEVAASAESLTGQYLARRLRIEPPRSRATLATQTDPRVLRIVEDVMTSCSLSSRRQSGPGASIRQMSDRACGNRKDRA